MKLHLTSGIGRYLVLFLVLVLNFGPESVQAFPYPDSKPKKESGGAKPKPPSTETKPPSSAPSTKPPTPSAPSAPKTPNTPTSPGGVRPPNTSRGQLGLTAEQSKDLADQLWGTMMDFGYDDPRMNAVNRLYMDMDAETRANINRWLAARRARQEKENEIKADTDRRVAMNAAKDTYRELARTYRAHAARTNDANLRRVYDNLGTAFDSAADTFDQQSEIPSRSERRAKRGELKDLEAEERSAERGVDAGIRRLIVDIEENPAERPQQQRVTVPSGN